MIPLRPTINLYYDKIVDDTPIPNGVSSYEFSKDIYRIPFASNRHGPVNRVTALYNVMKALEVPRVNVYSGKTRANNLFYPLELAPGTSWDVNFCELIPQKTIGRIKKGQMKLLIFAPRIGHNYQILWKLRQRLDYLSTVGITKEMIYIVLGDLNRVYRKLFDNENVYGIDWWQIYTQICYKSRYGYEDWDWVLREYSGVKRTKEEIQKEQFDIEKWNPKRIFTSLSGNTALHNTTLISEIIYRDLDQCNVYSYNLQGYANEKDYTDFRVTDKTRSAEYKEEKQKIIKALASVKKKIDYDQKDLHQDPLKIDTSIFENSLINIVSGSYTPMFDKHYLDEISTLAPGVGIWRQIAKGHPFISLGCLNTMRHVSNEGYFLPTLITNHHYDKIADTPKKVSMICDNLQALSNLTENEIKNKVDELIPFMKKNVEKFFTKPNKRKFEKLFSEMAYE